MIPWNDLSHLTSVDELCQFHVLDLKSHVLARLAKRMARKQVDVSLVMQCQLYRAQVILSLLMK